MAETALHAQLDTVTVLGSRIYPLVLPQNVKYPAVVYQRITATRHSAFGRDAQPAMATIQVDVYGAKASGYGAFTAVTEAVRAALQRQSSGAVIDMYLDAERDEYEDETELYRKTYDVRAWYRET